MVHINHHPEEKFQLSFNCQQKTVLCRTAPLSADSQCSINVGIILPTTTPGSPPLQQLIISFPFIVYFHPIFPPVRVELWPSCKHIYKETPRRGDLAPRYVEASANCLFSIAQSRFGCRNPFFAGYLSGFKIPPMKERYCPPGKRGGEKL